jgi:hypothetical protein
VVGGWLVAMMAARRAARGRGLLTAGRPWRGAGGWFDALAHADLPASACEERGHSRQCSGRRCVVLVRSVDRSIVTGMARSRGAFLLVVSDRQALGWILREQRTAFPPGRSRLPRALEPDDRLVLYTTRGCFGNPSLDRGRVIATAVVSTPVRDLPEAVVFGGRAFTSGCGLVINGLVPWRQGPELGPLVPRLRTFPAAWPVHLRAALVRLDDHDYGVLERELARVVMAREAVLPAYLDHAMPMGRRSAPQENPARSSETVTR